jgi:hypothetical protein
VTFLLLHISGATVGLIAGAMAVLFRKGSRWHSAAGTVFFVSMLCMSTSAIYMAAFLRPNRVNFEVAVLTFYLVSTAWVAARRKDAKVNLFDWAALLVILTDGVAGIIWGFMAASSKTGKLDHMPAPAYFIFGGIALWCATNDMRMIARGGFTGARRIARHLWRMCLALLIAGLSLYPGQAKLFPAALRQTNLLIVPQILLLGFMIFSLYRISRAYRAKRSATAGPITEHRHAAFTS